MKLDKGGCIYGAGVILRHVRSLEEEFGGVHSGAEDIEHIHRMRVASRRLRAVLPLFRDCLPRKKSAFWLDEIRKVTGALGAARDTDVQLEKLSRYKQKQKDPILHPGLNRLMLRLRQKRTRLQPDLTAALDELRDREVLESMKTGLAGLTDSAPGVYLFSPALYSHAWNSITGRLAEFLAFDEIVHQVEKVTELHNMRIAAKWLRYTMETFDALYPDALKTHLTVVREAQELLGDIHDCDVWGEFIPRFLSREYERVVAYFGVSGPFPLLVPGIQAFAEEQLRRRGELYAEYTAAWEKWRAEGVWDKLQTTLQVPPLGAAGED